MTDKNVFSKVLAISGTVLVLLPILFMLVTGVVGSIMSGRLLCDYMLPAELFPFVLVGSGALFWAALRERKLVAAVAWTVGGAVLLLISCQALASLSGLASGRVQAADAPGWMTVVIAMLIGYDLGVALLGYWGIRLCLKTFKRPQTAA